MRVVDLPVYRFCKTAFRGLKKLCDIANKDLGNEITPARLFCDALPLVDNGIDLLGQETVLFTPFAVFPSGNMVTAPGQVIRLSSGSSTVSEVFNIVNDQNNVHFSVFPFDPAPGENYAVTVTYECFSADFVVTMDIVGTDDYTDQIFCMDEATCVLYVPGAEALVQDTVTVAIEDTSATIVRRIFIIF